MAAPARPTRWGGLEAIADLRQACGAGGEPNPFPIITGTSAGAINAAALACGADNFDRAVRRIARVWRQFHANQVYGADSLSVMRSGARWLTLLSLGWAEEFRDAGIAFNCLWPQTYIATAAVANLAEGDDLAARSRSPQIMADAAVEIFSRPAGAATAQCFIDSAVLSEAGVSDLSRYGGGPDPIMDIFVDRR